MVTKSPKAAHTARADEPELGSLDRYFGITARGSTVGREIRGGIVTFFTMAYIIALNPLIIGTAPDSLGNLVGGLPYADAAGAVVGANVDQTITKVAAATALVAGVMTILMGVIGRFPIGIAAGLGLNALLAFTIAPQMTWPQAMGLIVIEGVLIALLVLTGFRTAVFKAVPRSLRVGISIGIGLFITFVGLFDAGFVRKPAGTPPVELGVNGSIIGWPLLIFVLGLFGAAILYAKRVKGATADLHRGCHRRRRADRAGHRCRGEDRRQPHGLGAERPPGRLDRGRARSRSDRGRGRVRCLRSLVRRRLPPQPVPAAGAAGLRAAAGGLLRHHGHGGRGRGRRATCSTSGAGRRTCRPS